MRASASRPPPRSSSAALDPGFYGTATSCDENYGTEDSFKINLDTLAIDYDKTTWFKSYCQGDAENPVGTEKISTKSKTSFAVKFNGKSIDIDQSFGKNYVASDECQKESCGLVWTSLAPKMSMCCAQYAPNCNSPACEGNIVLMSQTASLCDYGEYSHDGKTDCKRVSTNLSFLLLH